MQSPDQKVQLTRFPEGIWTEVLTPAQLYERIRAEFGITNTSDSPSRTYIQSPITSWIMQKIEKDAARNERRDYDSGAVIQANKQLARGEIHYLADTQQVAGVVTAAVHIERPQMNGDGQVRHWREMEFAMFWTMVELGLTVAQARAFEDFTSTKCRTLYFTINNRELSKEDRFPTYKEYFFRAQEWAHRQHIFDNGAQPVSQLIRTSGSHASPGSLYEKLIAEWVKAGIHEVILDSHFGPKNFGELLTVLKITQPHALLRTIATLTKKDFNAAFGWESLSVGRRFVIAADHISPTLELE